VDQHDRSSISDDSIGDLGSVDDGGLHGRILAPQPGMRNAAGVRTATSTMGQPSGFHAAVVPQSTALILPLMVLR
jgi:hypothetical protein